MLLSVVVRLTLLLLLLREAAYSRLFCVWVVAQDHVDRLELALALTGQRSLLSFAVRVLLRSLIGMARRAELVSLIVDH